MKIAIVHFAETPVSVLTGLAQRCKEAFGQTGREADIVNGYKDLVRPQFYGYFVFLVEAKGTFASKLNPTIGKSIAQWTGFAGKRCCVIGAKKLFFSLKVLQNAMKLIEGQGGFIRNSTIVDLQSDLSQFIGALDVEPPKR